MAATNITAVTVSALSIEAVGGLRARGGGKPAWQRRFALEADTDRAACFREIRSLAGGDVVTVALSPDASMVRLLRLPPAEDREIQAMIELQMARQIPFPGEDVAIGHEVVRRTKTGLWVLAAAAPLTVLNALDADARAAGLRILRVDLTLLGIWQRWTEQEKSPENGRAALLARNGEGLDLLVIEAGAPVMARRLIEGRDCSQLGLELTRSLMNLEMEQGPEPLVEICWIDTEPPDPAIRSQLNAVTDLALREVAADTLDSPALGVARRTLRAGTLNIFPSVWTARGAAQRNRRRTMLFSAAALVLWLVVVAMLWGWPYLAAQSLAEVRRSSEDLRPAYNRVRELRDRVRLVQRYTDQSRSLLESFRAASVLMPEGIELTSLNYRREAGLTVTGEALTPEQVYAFKERIDNAPIFGGSNLIGPTWNARRRRHVFELDAQWREELE